MHLTPNRWQVLAQHWGGAVGRAHGREDSCREKAEAGVSRERFGRLCACRLAKARHSTQTLGLVQQCALWLFLRLRVTKHASNSKADLPRSEALSVSSITEAPTGPAWLCRSQQYWQADRAVHLSQPLTRTSLSMPCGSCKVDSTTWDR